MCCLELQDWLTLSHGSEVYQRSDLNCPIFQDWSEKYNRPFFFCRLDSEFKLYFELDFELNFLLM